MNDRLEPRSGVSRWKRYETAAEGFREYWYPVMESRRLAGKPVQIKLLGETVAFVRENGRAYAIEDRCPHRGVPFSGGGTPITAKFDFSGHITCPYHGWVFELSTGRLAAALSDGPDSPIVGKVAVRTFPVEERCGLVWVWMGQSKPVPLDEDIPDELLAADARIFGRFSIREGNWRYAVENGFDEGHNKYLHRDSLWTMLRRLPGYNKTRIRKEPDGVWLSRVQDETYFESDYPGLGKWPRYHFWNYFYHPSSNKELATCSVRLPGVIRVFYKGWSIYEWYIPDGRGRHLYVQINIARTTGLGRLRWWLYYHLLVRAVQHRFLNNQDTCMVALMPDSHPERFFRPDASITGWRRFAEQTARDFTLASFPVTAEDDEPLGEDQEDA